MWSSVASRKFTGNWVSCGGRVIDGRWFFAAKFKWWRSTMEPNIPARNEEYSVRNSTDIPSHGTIPKWLDEISQWVVVGGCEEVLIFGFRKVVQNHDLQMEKNRDLAYNVDVKNFFDGLDRATRWGSHPESKFHESLNLSLRFSKCSWCRCVTHVLQFTWINFLFLWHDYL